jgi:hypothetical protein
VGSGASETTLEEGPTVDEETDAEEPATTTPSQTVTPASDPGGAGTETAEETTGSVETASPEEGGDQGATPTLTETPEKVRKLTSSGKHTNGDEEAPTGDAEETAEDKP